MEAVQAQVRSLTEELNSLRGEIIAVKGAHAVLHQSNVDAGAGNRRAFEEQAARIEAVEVNAMSVSMLSKTECPDEIEAQFHAHVAEAKRLVRLRMEQAAVELPPAGKFEFKRRVNRNTSHNTNVNKHSQRLFFKNLEK